MQKIDLGDYNPIECRIDDNGIVNLITRTTGEAQRIAYSLISHAHPYEVTTAIRIDGTEFSFTFSVSALHALR